MMNKHSLQICVDHECKFEISFDAISVIRVIAADERRSFMRQFDSIICDIIDKTERSDIDGKE